MVGIKFCDRQYVGKIKILQLDFQKTNYFNTWTFNAAVLCHGLWSLIIIGFFGGVMAVVFFLPSLQLHFSQKESSKPLKFS